MRDLYKIFDKLLEKDITFVFQRQSKGNFYNLSVASPKEYEKTLKSERLRDINAKTRYLHSVNLEDIERDIKLLYGHLLEETVTLRNSANTVVASRPAMPIPTMPLPPGM